MTTSQANTLAQLLGQNVGSQANVLTGQGALQAQLGQQAANQSTQNQMLLAQQQQQAITGGLGGLMSSGIFNNIGGSPSGGQTSDYTGAQYQDWIQEQG